MSTPAAGLLFLTVALVASVLIGCAHTWVDRYRERRAARRIRTSPPQSLHVRLVDPTVPRREQVR